MGLMRARAHRRVPIQMLVFGLVMLGANAYLAGGDLAAKQAVVVSLKQLAIQVPAGIVAFWLAARFIDADFGSIGMIALKIAGVTVLAEGVACWIPIPFFQIMALLTIVLFGYFWLFDLGKWETYLVVLLNIAVLFGAYYLLGRYSQGGGPHRGRPDASTRFLR